MSGILKNVRINESFSFRDFFYYIAGKSQKNSLNAPFHFIQVRRYDARKGRKWSTESN